MPLTVSLVKLLAFLILKKAFSLYSGFFYYPTDEERFRDAIVDPERGIHVPILICTLTSGKRLLIIRDEFFHLKRTLQTILADEDECRVKEKIHVLPEDKVNSIINHMDTEFERQCAKAIVALNYSRSEIERSGLRAETAMKSLSEYY